MTRAACAWCGGSDLALLMARYHGNIHRAADLKANTIVTLFEKTDALRRPERFQQLLDACLCDFTGRLGWENRPYETPQRLLTALAAVNSLDAGKIAAACIEKAHIPERSTAKAKSKVARQFAKSNKTRQMRTDNAQQENRNYQRQHPLQHFALHRRVKAALNHASP